MNNPKSRDHELVVQELEKEVLIYDLNNHKAYTLNETSAIIWQLCDGATSVGQMRERLAKRLKVPIDEEIVWLALDNFKRNNLLTDNENVRIEFNGLSRRQVIRKVGLASMITLPVISSLIAPQALNGASLRANFTSCSSPGQCQSGNCVSSPNPAVCCASGQIGNVAPNQAVGCANATCSEVNSCCSGSASPGTPIQFCTDRGLTTCYCN